MGPLSPVKEIVVDVREWVAEYGFRLAGIDTRITLRLYRERPSGHVYWEQSHFIKTPEQLGPYHTSRPWRDDVKEAVDAAFDGFVQHYRAAVARDHRPSDPWLVRNESFR